MLADIPSFFFGCQWFLANFGELLWRFKSWFKYIIRTSTVFFGLARTC